MATPNLAITHIAAAQNQPEVTANDAFDQLDDAANLAVSIANGDADQTLSQAQLASGIAITITGALTANRHVNLPASTGRLFLFKNGTTGSHSLIVQVTGAPGTTVSLPASAGLVALYSDGTNVTQLTGPGAGSGALYADNETPSGSCNGSNNAFTLANSPSPSASLILIQRFSGGGSAVLLQGTDYTLAGANITTMNAPASGDSLAAFYRH